eukprot:CAMPEP_0181169566 /NCGR_PEP_ID=MMETSP1096-20121128/884_1 /TAXON_ID=156174 ORGANISM="Chrysochromulina ericina, Strain CCMP281" /NCGR_SAMPLE_ID=MMETSP1096 /ASSEMBLY_ACC=CAM_ASM_000453 /LENGTH=201 /DNA_ID=CAMNT_0023257035 /DNA_START=287 /DNA_END=889 /DNA_ORIENTATION=-
MWKSNASQNGDAFSYQHRSASSRGAGDKRHSAALHAELRAVMKQLSHWKHEAVTLQELARENGLLSKVLPVRGEEPPSPQHHALADAVANMTVEMQHWRRVAGSYACVVHGIGPTGGFCMDPTRPPRGHSNACLAPRLADLLIRHLFTGTDVLDLGCGVGQYGEHFRRRSYERLGTTWLGIDGSEYIEEATSGRVRFGDLS